MRVVGSVTMALAALAMAALAMAGCVDPLVPEGAEHQGDAGLGPAWTTLPATDGLVVHVLPDVRYQQRHALPQLLHAAGEADWRALWEGQTATAPAGVDFANESVAMVVAQTPAMFDVQVVGAAVRTEVDGHGIPAQPRLGVAVQLVARCGTSWPAMLRDHAFALRIPNGSDGRPLGPRLELSYVTWDACAGTPYANATLRTVERGFDVVASSPGAPTATCVHPSSALLGDAHVTATWSGPLAPQLELRVGIDAASGDPPLELDTTFGPVHLEGSVYPAQIQVAGHYLADAAMTFEVGPC